MQQSGVDMEGLHLMQHVGCVCDEIRMQQMHEHGGSFHILLRLCFVHT